MPSRERLGVVERKRRCNRLTNNEDIKDYGKSSIIDALSRSELRIEADLRALSPNDGILSAKSKGRGANDY